MENLKASLLDTYEIIPPQIFIIKKRRVMTDPSPHEPSVRDLAALELSVLMGESIGRTLRGSFVPDAPLERSFTKRELASMSFELEQFTAKTGFPDLQAVSHRIEGHILSIVERTAEAAGVNIIFVGYCQFCSVGRGLALPGSDLDGLTIVLLDDEGAKDKIRSEWGNRIDRELVADVTLAMADIVTFSEFEKLRSVEWDERFIANGQSVLAALGRIARPHALFSDLSEEHLELVQAFASARPGAVNTGSDKLKPKLEARKKLIEFFLNSNASTPQKWVVMKMIQDYGMKDNVISLSASADHPYSYVLWDLCRQGVIEYNPDSASYVVPWLH